MVAIFGPRQTGKTTIVRQELERTKILGAYCRLTA